VAKLLSPRHVPLSAPEERESELFRIRNLEGAGFAFVPPLLASKLARLGATIVDVNTAVFATSEFWMHEGKSSQMVHEDDRQFVLMLEDIISQLELPQHREEVADTLLERLIRVVGGASEFTETQRAALETVVRLGDAKAVITLLEADVWSK
jgi:hypothetical protein